MICQSLHYFLNHNFSKYFLKINKFGIHYLNATENIQSEKWKVENSLQKGRTKVEKNNH